MTIENSIVQLKFFLKEMFQFNANDLQVLSERYRGKMDCIHIDPPQSPIQFRNENAIVMLYMAEQIIKEEGVVNEKYRKAYSKWINGNTDLTGSDKAYKYIDDDGQEY